jgi:hypothetical protein
LFIELGMMVTLSADDLKRNFCKIPVHKKEFGVDG